jgi:hypothetical protein
MVVIEEHLIVFANNHCVENKNCHVIPKDHKIAWDINFLFSSPYHVFEKCSFITGTNQFYQFYFLLLSYECYDEHSTCHSANVMVFKSY